MALNTDKRNRISEVIKAILLKRIENFPDVTTEVRNAPFHELILESFASQFEDVNIDIPHLVAIASWMHGLNTSLGSGFENIGHILSGGYKRKFTGPYILKVKSTQASNIENIIRELKAGTQDPDMDRENDLILNYDQSEDETDALGFSADVYIESDDEITAIEMKSVRPNSGEGRGEKQKILYGKAALKLANPDKRINFFLGFPFDPTASDPTASNKPRFFDYLIEFKKFFDPNEVLLASELWDYLSGSPNTMEEILEVVRDTVREVNP
jgi:hypothetical protein